MKKICMIVPSFCAKGGIAAVVSGYRGSAIENKYNIKYIETYSDGGKLKKLIYAFLGYIRFVREVVFNRPDIVHIHSSFGASFCRKLPFIVISRLFKCPVINHIHGAEFNAFFSGASEFKKYIIEKAYKSCSRLIALSDEWKGNLSQIVTSDKISIIENYSILQGNVDFCHTNAGNVLFLGFLCKRKGCLDIPYVVAKAAAKVPEIKFILAGSGEENEVNHIKKLCADLGVEQNVEFPGWVRAEEKDKLLRTAGVFFLPSYNEGMPMAILDAMGYGLPVVSTNIGGIPKIVQNGVNGYIFAPGNTDGFADALTEIISDTGLRRYLGNESRKIIEEAYSLEKHLEKLDKVYNEVLND